MTYLSSNKDEIAVNIHQRKKAVWRQLFNATQTNGKHMKLKSGITNNVIKEEMHMTNEVVLKQWQLVMVQHIAS